MRRPNRALGDVKHGIEEEVIYYVLGALDFKIAKFKVLFHFCLYLPRIRWRRFLEDDTIYGFLYNLYFLKTGLCHILGRPAGETKYLLLN